MTKADQLTLAFFEAKRDVLLHLRSEGVKIERIPMAVREKLAKDWLAKHPELIEAE
jgi:hypothetical protein